MAEQKARFHYRKHPLSISFSIFPLPKLTRRNRGDTLAGVAVVAGKIEALAVTNLAKKIGCSGSARRVVSCSGDVTLHPRLGDFPTYSPIDAIPYLSGRLALFLL